MTPGTGDGSVLEGLVADIGSIMTTVISLGSDLGMTIDADGQVVDVTAWASSHPVFQSAADTVQTKMLVVIVKATEDTNQKNSPI